MFFEFRQEPHVVVATYDGDIDYERLVEITEALCEQPEYDPAMSAVIDLREANLKLDYEATMRFAQWLESRNLRFRGRVAFLAGSAVGRHVPRMYDALAEELFGPVRYFDSRDDALSWVAEAGRVRDA